MPCNRTHVTEADLDELISALTEMRNDTAHSLADIQAEMLDLWKHQRTATGWKSSDAARHYWNRFHQAAQFQSDHNKLAAAVSLLAEDGEYIAELIEKETGR